MEKTEFSLSSVYRSYIFYVELCYGLDKGMT